MSDESKLLAALVIVGLMIAMFVVGLLSLIGSQVLTAHDVSYAEYRCGLINSGYTVRYFLGFPVAVDCEVK